MKINEVEKLLGITKANIRFYEKEGLLMPRRTENGYREYSGEDIARLKEIVIFRKLGIPVQQIADILDGALPLQDALNTNIRVLNEEIEKLNGSLALCHKLIAEDTQTLDTNRYWEIIHTYEKQSMRFQSLMKDYTSFMEPTLDRYLLHVPAKHERTPRMIIKYTAIFVIVFGGLNGIFTGDLVSGLSTQFISHFILAPIGFFAWCIAYLPAYLVGKKYPQLGRILKVTITVLVILTALFYFTWVIFG